MNPLLTAIAVLLTVTLIGPADASTNRPLVILFSGSNNGILRSCYCPNAPWGGLAKRAWLVSQVREAVGRDNVILMDSGDILPFDHEPARVPVLMEVYRQMEYDAVGIGEQDIRYCRELGLLSARRRDGFWLSGGYRISEGSRRNQLLSRPWMMKTAAGLRVGIVSVVGDEAYRFAQDSLRGARLTDPVRIVDVFVADYRTNLDFIVVLSHQGIDADRRMASDLHGVDLIVGGHSQSLISPPEVVNGIPICQAGKNGENMGVLVIGRAGEGGAPPAANDDPFAPSVIETARWRMIQQVVPLDAQVDENRLAADTIGAYYAVLDRGLIERARAPSRTNAPAPSLALDEPILNTVIRAGETQRFAVVVRNTGDVPLVIERVRSGSRWVRVVDFIKELPPQSCGDVLLELTAEGMDRYFRSEFTLTSNDKTRPVVSGCVNGRLDGPLPRALDVAGLMRRLTAMLRETPSPAPAPGRYRSRPEDGDEQVAARRVVVELFYSRGCEDCETIRTEVLPEARRRYGERLDIREYDVQDMDNYVRMVRLQEATGTFSEDSVVIFIDGRVCLSGLTTIRQTLSASVERAMAGKAGSTGGVAPGTRGEPRR